MSLYVAPKLKKVVLYIFFVIKVACSMLKVKKNAWDQWVSSVMNANSVRHVMVAALR